MDKRLKALTDAHNAAVEARDAAYTAVQDLAENVSDEVVDEASATFEDAQSEVERCKRNLDNYSAMVVAREATPAIETADEQDEDDEPELRSATPRSGTPDQPRGLTYRPDAPHSFYRDIMAVNPSFGLNDSNAVERLQRHAQEMAAEKRDVETTDWSNGGFVPPVYLADMWVALPRGKRPFADACTKIPLPPAGLTLTIPKQTVGVSVATQANEADAVSETDADADAITASVNTFAGQQDLSIQAAERTLPGFDMVIQRDLVNAYDEYLDTQLLSGGGSSGQHLGVRTVSSPNTVAYTDGSPTAAELFPKLYDALQKPLSNKVGPITAFWMHPRRSAWLASNLSSTFPLFAVGGAVQTVGPQNEGIALSVSGIPIRTDVNIGTTYGASTNEDEIYAVNMNEMFLAEGALRSRALPEVLSGTLQVRFQVYAYSAFIPHRLPKNITIVSGTGLVAPTF